MPKYEVRVNFEVLVEVEAECEDEAIDDVRRMGEGEIFLNATAVECDVDDQAVLVDD